MLLLALGLYGLYAQYVRVQPPSLTENPGFVPPMLSDGNGKMKLPTEEERLMVFAALDLTPEQQAQIKAKQGELGPATNPMQIRSRMEELEKILTPDQQQKLRHAMGDRMEERMRERGKVLPSAEREKYEQKLTKRREEMDRRIANGERPFPPGMPPQP